MANHSTRSRSTWVDPSHPGERIVPIAGPRRLDLAATAARFGAFGIVSALAIAGCSSSGGRSSDSSGSGSNRSLSGSVEIAVEHAKQTGNLCVGGSHTGVDIEDATGTTLAVAPLTGWKWVALGRGGYYGIYSCQATFAATVPSESIYELHVAGSDPSKDKTVEASSIPDGKIPLFDS